MDNCNVYEEFGVWVRCAGDARVVPQPGSRAVIKRWFGEDGDGAHYAYGTGLLDWSFTGENWFTPYWVLCPETAHKMADLSAADELEAWDLRLYGLVRTVRDQTGAFLRRSKLRSRVSDKSCERLQQYVLKEQVPSSCWAFFREEDSMPNQRVPPSERAALYRWYREARQAYEAAVREWDATTEQRRRTDRANRRPPQRYSKARSLAKVGDLFASA